LLRFLKYGVVLSLAVLLVTALSIHLQQRILRARAERLLADVRSLELRKATFEEAQPVFRRWHDFGHYNGECNQQRCTFEVTLQDIVLRHLYMYPRSLFLLRIEELLGGRPARIFARIGVQNGVVWEKSFGLFLVVWPFDGPRGNTSEYTLIATAHSVSRFSPWQERYLIHPNYVVGRPGGCEGCLAVFVEFTPYADPADVRRLMQFDLSCLTRWKRCLVQGDIMPDVWAEHSREVANYEWGPLRRTCGSQVAELLGRDAEDAAIVDVVSSRRGAPAFDGGPIQVFTVRLVERLKRAAFWDVGATRDFSLSEDNVGLAAPNTLSQVRPGSRFILLFSKYPIGGSGQDTWLEVSCAMPFSQSHLALVRRGIKQDYEAAETDKAYTLP
jgi:hypothetical protein